VFDRQDKTLEAEVFLELVRYWTFNYSGNIGNLERIKAQLHLALLNGDGYALSLLNEVCRGLDAIQCTGMPYAFVRLRIAEIYRNDSTQVNEHILFCEKWLVQNPGFSVGRKQFEVRLTSLKKQLQLTHS
jgi:hypothetical protein